jgi:hypothetical protein
MTDEKSEAQRLRDEFHMMMGYCIAAWSQVDDELYRIFQDCMALRDHSAIIYYRAPGLDSRLGLVEEIVRTTLLPSWERPGNADPRIKAWKAVAKDFRALLSVRRRIAHQPVKLREISDYVEEGYAEPGYFTPLESWFEIYVSEHERLRDNAAKLPPLQIDDLRNHQTAVHRLKDQLRSFYRDVLIKHYEASPLPNHPSPPPNPPKTDRGAAPRRRRQSSPP